MEISLTPEQQAFLQEKLDSGRYGSVSEVVGEALRLLEDEEELRARELAQFREEMQRRLDSLDRGEGIPGKEVEAYFREKAAIRRRQAA